MGRGKDINSEWWIGAIGRRIHIGAKIVEDMYSKMIVVESDGISKLLDIFWNIVKSGRSPNKKDIEALLSTKTISFIVEAYSRWSDFSKEGFSKIIANLGRANPVGQGTVLSKLEEGFRSCLSQEKINLLSKKLEDTLRLDFTEAERKALRHLPPKTPIKSTIHLIIDTYNPGMMFEGNVSLSILHLHPENVNFSYLAHELHHSGFQYWIRKNPRLKKLAYKGNTNHQEIAVNMVLYLLSEGMANYYCTPSMVHINTKSSKKYKQKIKKYERDLNHILLEIESLLSDCTSKHASVEACKERLMNILLDPEGILPPVHYIGARIVEMFETDPTISKENIVNLCKEPFRFFCFYAKVYRKYELPRFSNEVIREVSALLGKS